MKEKRKISVRKILQLLLTITVAAGCIIAMVSASSIEGEKPLKSLPVVHIKNDRKYQFIEQQKIMDLAIYNRNIDILRTPVSKLGLRGIEKAIKADPWVADAQVFVDIDRVMHIYVTQRVPVARIFRHDGTSYYMDSTLHSMPLSESYTYYTVVVTNSPEMGDDSAGVGLRKQIATLVKAISIDSFWSAQVSQVIVDSAGMFELMPVLGNQRILFGDTANMGEKFSNLLAFYKNVLNRIGWDKYETLDVRFHGQVVASPSLPYKGPMDKAISKMNWITSIEVTEAQKMHEDSVRDAEKKWAAMEETKAKSAERARMKEEDKKKGIVPVHGRPSKVAIQEEAARKALKLKSQKAASKSKVVDTKNKMAVQTKPAATKGAKGQSPADAKKTVGVAAKKEATKTKLVKSEKKGVVAGHPSSKKLNKKLPAAGIKAGKKTEKVKSSAKTKADKNKKKAEAIKKNKGGAAKYTYPANKGN